MDKCIDHLFIRLAAIYGHLWSNLYQNEEFIKCSKREWHEGLQSFEPATIGKALERCRDRINYPPTLPMFIEICKSVHPSTNHLTQNSEPQRGDLAVAKQHLTNIRFILNKK